MAGRDPRGARAEALGGGATGAYLLIAQPDSPLRVTLTRPGGPATFAPGARAAFTLQAADGAPLHALQVEARLGGAPLALPSTLNGGDTLSLALPATPGVYNLSLTVRGQTSRGLPFERSLTTSFATGGARKSRGRRPAPDQRHATGPPGNGGPVLCAAGRASHAPYGAAVPPGASGGASAFPRSGGAASQHTMSGACWA